MTDHRIGFTLHGLSQVMEGAIGPLIDALQKAHHQERLAALEGRAYELAGPPGVHQGARAAVLRGGAPVRRAWLRSFWGSQTPAHDDRDRGRQEDLRILR